MKIGVSVILAELSSFWLCTYCVCVCVCFFNNEVWFLIGEFVKIACLKVRQ